MLGKNTFMLPTMPCYRINIFQVSDSCGMKFFCFRYSDNSVYVTFNSLYLLSKNSDFSICDVPDQNLNSKMRRPVEKVPTSGWKKLAERSSYSWFSLSWCPENSGAALDCNRSCELRRNLFRFGKAFGIWLSVLLNSWDISSGTLPSIWFETCVI